MDEVRASVIPEVKTSRGVSSWHRANYFKEMSRDNTWARIHNAAAHIQAIKCFFDLGLVSWISI